MAKADSAESARPTGPRRLLPTITLPLMLLLALGIRLFDLTDPPLDFHPTRQLRSAMIARGMYYAGLDDVPEWQRELADRQQDSQEALEPTILETLVAFAYRLAGGERLWLARLFSSFFWVAGGLALYGLGKDLSSHDGALVGTAYFLFLPFAVTASRSFQPDPLMVALSICGWWALCRWAGASNPSLLRTVEVGLVASLGPLVKVVAVFPLIGVLIGLLVARGRLRAAIRDPKVWVLIVVSLLPVTLYYVRGIFITREMAGETYRFMPALLISPRFYLDWQEIAVRVVGYGAIVAAVIGTLALRGRALGLVLGLWGGYLVYGMAFPHYTTTHDYYQLPLLPILGLAMMPAAEAALGRIRALVNGRWAHAAALLALAALLVMPLRLARGVLIERDFRPEIDYWERLGNLLEHSGNVIMLSHDYGFRLEYYGWVAGQPWPSQTDFALSDVFGGPPDVSVAEIQERLSGGSYFISTIPGELDAQPLLARYLEEAFPIVERGDDFVIYDLQHPLSPGE